MAEIPLYINLLSTQFFNKNNHIYIFIQALKIVNILTISWKKEEVNTTKQGRTKQTLYVDESVVTFVVEKSTNFLLKKRRKKINTKNCNYPMNYTGLRLVSNDSTNNNIKNK